MTQTQIKYFVAVATFMNFTKAADQMFVTQQVISKQVKRLEEEVGFSLFVRHSGGIALTNGGRLLYEYWEKMLKEQNEVMVRASEIMKQEAQMIRIGMLDVSRIYDWVSAAVSAVGEENPDWRFRVESDSHRNLYQKLVDARYDCIVSLSDELPELSVEHKVDVICELHPKLVIAETHPAYHDGMSVRDLEDSVLYVLSPKFSRNSSKNIMQYCKNAGIKPRRTEYYDETNSLEIALHAGRGFTLMYELFFRNPIGKLKFFDLEKGVHDTENGIALIYVKTKEKQLRRFVECLKTRNF